jgi:hypothetical protein
MHTPLLLQVIVVDVGWLPGRYFSPARIDPLEIAASRSERRRGNELTQPHSRAWAKAR